MDELTQAVLGVAVDELVPDLLVDDAAHAGELAIERHAVVGRLEDEAAGRRGGRARRAAAERKRPVSERRDAARQEDELARIDLGRQSDRPAGSRTMGSPSVAGQAIRTTSSRR